MDNIGYGWMFNDLVLVKAGLCEPSSPQLDLDDPRQQPGDLPLPAHEARDLKRKVTNVTQHPSPSSE